MTLDDEIAKNVGKIVNEAIIETLGIEDESRVQDSASLAKDLNADSLDLSEIHLEIENKLEEPYGLKNLQDPSEFGPTPTDIGEYKSYVTNEVRRYLESK